MIVSADQHIPLLDTYLADHCEILRLPPFDITPEHLQHTDILITRSNTPINAALLATTPIQCVATPSSGADHFDHAWLLRQKIPCFHAPGCNANAVVEYVLAAIEACQHQQKLNKGPLRIAIVGVGQVGTRLYQQLRQHEVLLCDPIRAQTEKNFPHTDFNAIQNVDLVTFHVPLTASGDYPTAGMVTLDWLKQLPDNCVIINAARGDIITAQTIIESPKTLSWCLDVFPNEPNIHPKVLARATCFTPHIAGHSMDGKWRGVYQISQQIRHYFHWPKLPGFTPPEISPSVRKPYDLLADMQRFEKNLAKHVIQDAFQITRNTYPYRRDYLCSEYV